jgi:sugar phosphate isomerase/epimerase
VRTHLDTGCVTLAGDEIGAEILATGAGLAHFHIAEPDLAGFEAPTCPHAAAAAALREIGYDGWHVIEMREPADGVAALETAVRFARGVYG